MPPAPRRSAADWVDAAYARFSEHGLSAVRVEAVARDLGATKGSFYWHFPDRTALVRAVVDRWETEQTDRSIAATETAASPAEQLVALFRAVGAHAVPGEDSLYLEAAAEGVAEAVERVSTRRREFVASVLRRQGVDEVRATRWAQVALAAAVGSSHLDRVEADSGGADRHGVGRGLLELLIAASGSVSTPSGPPAPPTP